MPILTYEATSFPTSYGPAFVGSHDLTFNWAELVWAAISVGRRELSHITRHGPYSTFEIVYRVSILYANLRETTTNSIRRSEAYKGLDPSEKGAVSYFMGLAVTKLFIERLLDVPWLMHLDVYREELKPVLSKGETKPDLVGRNTSGNWIAIESKGRTHGFNQTALDRAKEQVENLSTINGTAPSLRVALLTHFGSGHLQCAVNDPDEKKEGKIIDIPLTQEKFKVGYYRPFREWLRATTNTRTLNITGQQYRVTEMPEVNISVGVRTDILANETTDLTQIETGERISGDNYFIGRDGIYVSVGELWSEENMMREPQERSQNI